MSSERFLMRCEDHVKELMRDTDDSLFSIRGIWLINYALKLSELDFPTERKCVVVEACGFGSAHFDTNNYPSLPLNLIGGSAIRKTSNLQLPYRIAVLDAAASIFQPVPDAEFIFDGNSQSKLASRSKLVIDEAMLLAKSSGSVRPRIVLVGALGSILAGLKSNPDIDVFATDGNPNVVGKNYHGVIIEPSECTLDRIASADVSIVTGMALTTNSMDEVIDTCVAAGGRLLLYMQTGANLIVPALEQGVSTVISEPYPFYFMGSSVCTIRVFRRGQGVAPAIDSPRESPATPNSPRDAGNNFLSSI